MCHYDHYSGTLTRLIHYKHLLNAQKAGGGKDHRRTHELGLLWINPIEVQRFCVAKELWLE
jgi:hypothetical protein